MWVYKMLHSFRFVLKRRDGVLAIQQVVQGSGRRDMMFLFPPSENEGYNSDQDIPFLSVTDISSTTTKLSYKDW